MKRLILWAAPAVGLLSLTVARSAIAADDPQVKMSKSNICHEKGSEFYTRVKTFTPYASMAACEAAGGRAPQLPKKGAAAAPVIAPAPPKASPAPSPAKKTK